jgi:hypothetical protein
MPAHPKIVGLGVRQALPAVNALQEKQQRVICWTVLGIVYGLKEKKKSRISLPTGRRVDRHALRASHEQLAKEQRSH